MVNCAIFPKQLSLLLRSAGALKGLVKDSRKVLNDACNLVKACGTGSNLLKTSTPEAYDADTSFYQAAKAFAATPLATLREEGLQTSFTDGEQLAWAVSSSFCPQTLLVFFSFTVFARVLLVHSLRLYWSVQAALLSLPLCPKAASYQSNCRSHIVLTTY